MKKVFLIFATCAFLVTSCNQNDVVESLEQDMGKLSFNTVIGKQTKAAELTNDGLQKAAASKNKGIALYAYQKVSDTWNPWYTDGVWYADGKWQIESTRFANTAPSKYVTYYPTTYVTPSADFATADFNITFPKFDYTIQATNSQEDLIAGISDVAASKKDITLGMRHILSQINFGVKGYNGAFIQIQNIKIHDVYNSATYTYRGDNLGTSPNIIGSWGGYGSFGKGDVANEYTYSGTTTTVPATANTGDKYIFGDGGNWGPGKEADTWYPVGDANAWVAGDDVTLTNKTKMFNSLMLMPQNFTTEGASNKDAYVTFEYKIWDTGSNGLGSNAGYAAGSSSTWATGQFKLDFNTGENTYKSQWDQNYRYVYIIDFEKFLDDNRLDFTVEVDLYPWLNYNDPGDGIVGIPVAGIPTNTQLNTLTDKDTWYVATRRSTTLPATTAQVQLIQTQIWNWETYGFTGLVSGQSLDINFSNVVFNGKTLTINVGTGYNIYVGTEAETQSITVTENTQLVTIKKK